MKRMMRSGRYLTATNTLRLRRQSKIAEGRVSHSRILIHALNFGCYCTYCHTMLPVTVTKFRRNSGGSLMDTITILEKQQILDH